MKKILLSILAGASFLLADASHLKGGSISVLCNDDPATQGLEYQVIGMLIRDMSGIAAPTTMNVTYGGMSSTLAYTWSYTLPGGSAGMEVIFYGGDIVLQSGTNYTVEYSMCCRPGYVANIQNAGSYNLHLEAYVNTSLGCNSTPFFLTPPSMMWPDGISWSSSRAAFDLDGDSLYYVIDTAYQSNGVHVGGYTHPPHDPSNPPAIDPVSGLFSMTSAGQGLFSLTVRVEAYDDSTGVLTGIVYLDGSLFSVIPPNVGPLQVQSVANVVAGTADFTTAGLDTVSMVAVSDTDITAMLYLMPDVDTNDIYFNVQTMKRGGTAEVDFTWTPKASDVGRAIPVIVRFESEGFHYDYEFIATASQSTIGASEFGVPNLMVYPNPSNGEFTLLLDREMESFKVLDLSGREVDAKVLHSGEREVRVTMELASGIYYVQVISVDGSTVTKPVIID